MESERRFRKEASANNSSQEKPSKKRKNRSFNYEITWPLYFSTLTLRPFHIWDVGRRARIKEGERVLELGAGYPLWRIYSGKVGETGLFLALDCNETISKRSGRITRFLNFGKKRPSEQILTADANNLPFSDESIDLIIINQLSSGLAPENYSHVVYKDVYKEAFRVLKPKGRLISSSIISLGSDMDLLNKAGFTDVQTRIGIPAGIAIIPNMFAIASKPSPKDASTKLIIEN